MFAASAAASPQETSLTANGPSIVLPPQGTPVGFAGAAGDRVSLLTQPAGASGPSCMNVSITAPDGATPVYSHQQCGGPDFSDALTLPASGVYGIVVDPPGGATLSLFAVAPDASGALIAGGSAATVTIAAPGQNAAFVFDGGAGDRVRLLVQADGALHRQCFAIAIIAPDGKTAVYGKTQCGASDLSGTLTLPASGRYTIRLDPARWATGTATLMLFHAPSDGAALPGTTRFSAVIAAPGQVARFSFHGLVGNRVSLLTEADSALRRQCLQVAITAPDGKVPLYSHDVCGAPDFSQALTLPADGSYALALTPLGGTVGTAALTLFTVPPDATGTVAVGGSAAALATVIPGQAMRVSFAGSANQSAGIAVTADAALSSQCYTVSLLGPDGTVLRHDEACDTAYASAAQPLPASGIYTIAIASTGTATGAAAVGVSGP